MPKHHTIHKHEPIRNLAAFLKAYVASDSFKRALTRNPSYVEYTGVNSRKQPVKWREFSGGNAIAHALNNATIKA